MKRKETLGLALAAMALMGFLASAAKATILESSGATIVGGTEIQATLETGSSSSLSTTDGTMLKTCTSSEAKGEIKNAGGSEATVTAPIGSLSFAGCTGITVESLAELEIHHIKGTDDGTLTAQGFRLQIHTGLKGREHCTFTAGAGTDLGTVTGSPSGKATVDIDASVSLYNNAKNTYLCPSDARWVAKYRVTTPHGLRVTGKEGEEVEGEEPGEGTTIESTGTKVGTAAEIKASLETGSSSSLSTTGGTEIKTCTSSEAKGEIKNAGGSEATVTAPIGSLSFGGCTGVTVESLGQLEIHHIKGTDDGTLTAEGFTVTVHTEIFGLTKCTFTAGAGLDLGTLTGSSSGNATIHVDTPVQLLETHSNTFLCPTDARWIAKYQVTAPHALQVTDGKDDPLEGTTIESTGTKVGTAAEIKASLETGSSSSLSTTGGTEIKTCTSSEAKGEIKNAGGSGATVTAPIGSLSFAGCTGVTVESLAELEIHHIKGTDDGTLTAKGFTINVHTSIFGLETCTFTAATGADLGSVTGSPSGKATMHVDAAVLLDNVASNTFLCPGDARWIAKYEVTSPHALQVREG